LKRIYWHKCRMLLTYIHCNCGWSDKLIEKRLIIISPFYFVISTFAATQLKRIIQYPSKVLERNENICLHFLKISWSQMIFANNLDRDQASRNIGTGLVSILFDKRIKCCGKIGYMYLQTRSPLWKQLFVCTFLKIFQNPSFWQFSILLTYMYILFYVRCLSLLV